jgi:hypothetical protein
MNSFGANGNPAMLVASAALVLLLALELANRVTMKRDLEIAREIQQWLVPKSPPVVVGIDIAFATRPAKYRVGRLLRCLPAGSRRWRDRATAVCRS